MPPKCNTFDFCPGKIKHFVLIHEKDIKHGFIPAEIQVVPLFF